MGVDAKEILLDKSNAMMWQLMTKDEAAYPDQFCQLVASAVAKEIVGAGPTEHPKQAVSHSLAAAALAASRTTSRGAASTRKAASGTQPRYGATGALVPEFKHVWRFIISAVDMTCLSG